MRTATFSEFRGKLKDFLDNTVKDHTPLIVKRQSGEDVVVLSLEDYNSHKETVDILTNPRNAEHIRRSMEQAELGLKVPFNSVDELENVGK